MLTSDELKETIANICLEESEETRYTKETVEKMLTHVESYSYTGLPFNEVRKTLGLHETERLKPLIEQYYNRCKGDANAGVAKRGYEIAVLAKPSEANTMIKHITETQLNWQKTQEVHLKDTTQDSFVQEYDSDK